MVLVRWLEGSIRVGLVGFEVRVLEIGDFEIGDWRLDVVEVVYMVEVGL